MDHVKVDGDRELGFWCTNRQGEREAGPFERREDADAHFAIVMFAAKEMERPVMKRGKRA